MKQIGNPLIFHAKIVEQMKCNLGYPETYTEQQRFLDFQRRGENKK